MLEANARAFAFELFGLDSPEQGIVHVISPELGATQPGMTIVCGDSHTATHGAFGALAFGIGTSEVEHVLATQCLVQARPKTMEVRFTGRPPAGVTPKDFILALIGRIGTDGASGYVIEYTGEVIRALSMEGRMTICNMSIEAGARARMIAPDETTFAYLAGRPRAPSGRVWDTTVAGWRNLATDAGAVYDREVVSTQRRWRRRCLGTNRGIVAITARVRSRGYRRDSGDRRAVARALEYGPRAGNATLRRTGGPCVSRLLHQRRIGDLRASRRGQGRRVAKQCAGVVMPGSMR